MTSYTPQTKTLYTSFSISPSLVSCCPPQFPPFINSKITGKNCQILSPPLLSPHLQIHSYYRKPLNLLQQKEWIPQNLSPLFTCFVSGIDLTGPESHQQSPPPPSMGHPNSISPASRSDSDPGSEAEFEWPFGQIDYLRRSDLRETAYEVFFMSCRSSPGFGSRNAMTYPFSTMGEGDDGRREGPGSPGAKSGGTMMVVNSRIKKALGLKSRRSSMMRPMNQTGATSHSGMASPGRGVASPGRVKRPMTSAEIMRQQMRVTELSDNRLRKTLMRTLVGQMGRKADTIILPLELLRQLKSSEFYDAHEYHQWQRRQLKILEAGLLLHPAVVPEKLNSAALQLKEVIRFSEMKPIDTSKNSEAMRNLCSSVIALAWRSPNGTTSEVCHWADGFPLNIHLYLALLQSIFDLREETVVLDEVDELIELMKKTWPTLGINRMIHNVCFTWVLFHQYIVTGQVEPDLIRATLAMLVEVANDAKRLDRESCYMKVVSAVLASMQGWAEKKLLDYHESFDKGTVENMENILSLALSTTKIINEDVSSMVGSGVGLMERDSGTLISRMDGYIRSSMRNTFTKIFETGHGRVDSMIVEVDEDPAHVLIQLAQDTEALALAEKETFSPVLKQWHPVPAAIAFATLHNCFGIVLKHYLAKVNALSNEVVQVLQTASKLEKILIQMVMEDSVDCDESGKGIVREMRPYEVDSIITGLLKSWIEERLRMGKECVSRAKETESWIPRSKTEPYAQSAFDLMKLAKVAVDEFFEIPVSAREDMVQNLADGLESIFHEYTSFVASCGAKQSYMPPLPPLTRCNQDSRFAKLWKKAKPIKSGSNSPTVRNGSIDGHHPRPSTSRGTQRLYIRLNTLYYLHSHVHSLDKSLSFFSRNPHGASIHPSPSIRGPSPSLRASTTRPSPLRASNTNRRLAPSCHFDFTRSTIQSAILHVSEVAAYRLIFLDSNHSLYDDLYIAEIESSRIHPALRILKQNLTMLVSVLTDRAQPGAVKEVMKASFEAFLMVLLAGGTERAFVRSDYDTVLEDFRSLKRTFCTSGEGLVAEEVVDKEATAVEDIIALMGLPTERLIEEISIAACESSQIGGLGAGIDSPRRVLPMPPTTGRWNRANPNTVLRVLCHRNDDLANHFLKKAFQLPKRR